MDDVDHDYCYGTTSVWWPCGALHSLEEYIVSIGLGLVRIITSEVRVCDIQDA